MALSLHRYTDRYPNPNSSLLELLKLRAEKERENARSISIAPENGNRLPENVLIEILSWLPAKEVLQYKSVCKTWYAILSSPRFISKHVQNNRGKCNDNCLLAVYQVTFGERQLFELFVDETPRILDDEVLYHIPSYNTYLYGPCDGLYYLCSKSFRALWNPTINEVRTLPPITLEHNPTTAPIYPLEDYFNFGLDPVSGDYKVVVIYDYRDADTAVSYPLSVFVYSLRTKSWKYCGDLARRYELENNKSYILVKGCCFWLGSNEYEDENLCELIISFNMTSDSFQELSVPNYEHPASNSLGMYEDSLAFFSVRKDPQIFDIWTLNDGIWSKTFTLGPIPECCVPIGFWKFNKVLARVVLGKLVLCDLDTQEIEDLAFKGPSLCHGIFSYMESLLSIKDSETQSRDDE